MEISLADALSKCNAAMNKITGEKFTTAAAALLKEYGLWEKRFELFRNLSGGMQQKAALIRSIIHEPDVK